MVWFLTALGDFVAVWMADEKGGAAKERWFCREVCARALTALTACLDLSIVELRGDLYDANQQEYERPGRGM